MIERGGGMQLTWEVKWDRRWRGVAWMGRGRADDISGIGV